WSAPISRATRFGLEAGAPAQDGADERAEAESLVARVTTSEPLDGRDRTVAEELIRLDVPDVDRVVFATE
ncbi:hypothetical protein EVA_20657, partial [gut metagenome]